MLEVSGTTAVVIWCPGWMPVGTDGLPAVDSGVASRQLAAAGGWFALRDVEKFPLDGAMAWSLLCAALSLPAHYYQGLRADAAHNASLFIWLYCRCSGV